MDYKEKIMGEFIKQFAQKDCKDIKVDEIAENLGISKRTIYENFSSKDDIIEQTLRHYQQLEVSRTLSLCENETNPLRKMLSMCFSIVEHAQHITISRLMSLKKQYPEIAGELIKVHVAFVRKTMLVTYFEAQEQGLIFKEIEPEFLLALLVGGEKDHKQKIIHFMGRELDTLKLFTAHLFTIIRGVSTLKGVEICDDYYKEMIKDKIENN